LPALEKYEFVLRKTSESPVFDEEAMELLLGLCPRCHTIFWEEA
jgi:hypothetical protein